MALSDAVVPQAEYSGACAGGKHTDGQAMYLLVKPTGKYWRMQYRFGGKRKTLALGVHPDVTFSNPRVRRAVARRPERCADHA